MKIACLASVLCGALILLISIIKYQRSLLALKNISHERRAYSHWTYTLCMVLMIFFFLGYLATGITFATLPTLTTSNLLVALIFLFGAVFVFVVITVQNTMSRTISGRTEEIIITLVNAMEAKDGYTRGHSEHVSNLTLLFYSRLPDKIRRKVDITHLLDAAVLHDIGKIGIADTVLNKPGRLTDDEMSLIRQHPRLGKQILEHTSFNHLGNIILCHHERVDGRGYYGIPPEQIPVEAKIIAIADTFSALYSDRVYRPRMSFEEAVAVLKEEAGTHLDAELVDIFLGISREEIDRTSTNLFF